MLININKECMRKITLNKPHRNKMNQGRNTLNLPHELDQMPDDQAIEPRPIMQQAYDDLQRGLVDTDMRGDRGVEEVVKNTVKITVKKNRHVKIMK
jgi:hypothetical protein